jgi:polysaccharide export outer membrane protein
LLSILGCSSNETAPKNDARGVSPATLPLPVPFARLEPETDYQIGPRDLLTIRVFELEKVGEATTIDTEVSANGEICLPLVGVVNASGKSVAEVQRLIVSGLAEYLLEPQVSVIIKDYRSRWIGVIGAVERPNIYYLNRNRITMLQALSLGGGLSKDAGTKAVITRSAGPDTIPASWMASGDASPVATVDSMVPAASRLRTPGLAPSETAASSQGKVIDLVPLLLNGSLQGTPLALESGDVIVVPLAEEFFVSGFVQKGGSFPYHRPTTVLQAIAMAGGLDEHRASPSACKIKRRTPTGYEVIPVDLGAIASGDEPDVPIFPGDSIRADRTLLWGLVTETQDLLKGTVFASIPLTP